MKVINTKFVFLILALNLFLISNVFCQNNLQDVVYLKNGSIIRGIIVEQIPNKSLKIQTNDRNLFFFNLEEIEKITKENNEFENSRQLKTSQFKKKGFIAIVEFNFGLGVGKIQRAEYSGNIGNNETNYLGGKVSLGYQINEHIIAGCGLGYELDTYGNRTPIFLDMRFPIIKGQFSPSFNLATGTLIGEKDNFFINPSFGIKVFISKNVAYNFNLGMNIKKRYLTYYTGNQNPYKTQIFIWQYLSFATGFSF
jgi:hypothetical protein